MKPINDKYVRVTAEGWASTLNLQVTDNDNDTLFLTEPAIRSYFYIAELSLKVPNGFSITEIDAPYVEPVWLVGDIAEEILDGEDEYDGTAKPDSRRYEDC